MGKLYLFTDNPVSCPLPFLLSVSAFCILVFCYYFCFELFVDRLSWLTVRSAREWEYTLEPIVLDTRLAPSAFATADAVADYVLHILTPTVTWVGADVREGQMPGQQLATTAPSAVLTQTCKSAARFTQYLTTVLR